MYRNGNVLLPVLQRVENDTGQAVETLPTRKPLVLFSALKRDSLLQLFQHQHRCLPSTQSSASPPSLMKFDAFSLHGATEHSDLDLSASRSHCQHVGRACRKNHEWQMAPGHSADDFIDRPSPPSPQPVGIQIRQAPCQNRCVSLQRV